MQWGAKRCGWHRPEWQTQSRICSATPTSTMCGRRLRCRPRPCQRAGRLRPARAPALRRAATRRPPQRAEVRGEQAPARQSRPAGVGRSRDSDAESAQRRDGLTSKQTTRLTRVTRGLVGVSPARNKRFHSAWLNAAPRETVATPMAFTAYHQHAADAWRPDLYTFAPTDAVPDALILQCNIVAGEIEGDEPVMRVAYVDDDRGPVHRRGRRDPRG